MTFDDSVFECVWIAEHHGIDYGGAIPRSEILLAAVAARTKRMRLGLGSAILSLRDPIASAETIQSLDQLSAGRVELAMGKGFLNMEFAERGLDPVTAIERFNAVHDLLMSALEGEVVNAPDFAPPIHEVTVRPPSFKGRKIDTWLTTATSPEGLELAGRAGHHLMINYYTRSREEIEEAVARYQLAASRAGHDLSRKRIATIQPLFIGDDVAPAEEAMGEYLDAVEGAIAQSVAMVAGDERASTVNARLARDTRSRLISERMSIGSVFHVGEMMAQIAELGFSDVLFMPQFGRLDWDHAHRSLERLSASL